MKILKKMKIKKKENFENKMKIKKNEYKKNENF